MLQGLASAVGSGNNPLSVPAPFYEVAHGPTDLKQAQSTATDEGRAEYRLARRLRLAA